MTFLVLVHGKLKKQGIPSNVLEIESEDRFHEVNIIFSLSTTLTGFKITQKRQARRKKKMWSAFFIHRGLAIGKSSLHILRLFQKACRNLPFSTLLLNFESGRETRQIFTAPF